MTKAKENWIEEKCNDIEQDLVRNNSKKAYQTVKELSSAKQNRSSIIQDKEGNRLTEGEDIMKRWTQYCSELYNVRTDGDPSVLQTPQNTDTDNFPILREEVEAAVKALKKGKSAGVDNIPGELVQASREEMISILHEICNKIWETGKWPSSWTQSLVNTLPKKSNLQQCQNYRTISLISHPSKIMLRIILNRLTQVAERIIKEEQAGFRKGRSTTEQIFNLRLICEKCLQHQQDLYHVLIDFKKAFDRVWHEALWATMRLFNINENLIRSIQSLYSEATSAVYLDNKIGEWFRTTVGVRQGCLLSPTLFNLFLERIMDDALEGHEGTVSIGGRTISNLRFADDIDGLAGKENELVSLVGRLDVTSNKFGMQISAEKTELMTNNVNGINSKIKIDNKELKVVKSFKYLGAIVSDQGSKPEIVSRIGQTHSAINRLKTIWKDNKLSTSSKIRLLRSLVISIFLYACETWTLTKETEKRIQALEMKCFRRVLGISYKDRVKNEEVKRRIRMAIGNYEELLPLVIRRKLRWFGLVTRSSGLSKVCLQGTVEGQRKRGRQKTRWEATSRIGPG